MISLPMYTECSPLFGIFVSRNSKYNNSETKNKHNKMIRIVISRPINNVKELINDITKIYNFCCNIILLHFFLIRQNIPKKIS